MKLNRKEFEAQILMGCQRGKASDAHRGCVCRRNVSKQKINAVKNSKAFLDAEV